MYLNYFFDRDNTLIIDKGYTHNLKDLKWIPGALDVLKTLSSKNKRIFIVTNQAGIAKGKFTLKQYKIFNKRYDIFPFFYRVFVARTIIA